MNAKVTSWILILVFCALKVNCDEKLYEKKSVNKNGDVTARVVAKIIPLENINVRPLGSKHIESYNSDDEDSTQGESSGESERNDDVAHDEPMAVLANTTTSVSPLKSVTLSSTINVVVNTVTGSAKSASRIASTPTTQTSNNISMTPRPQTVERLTSTSSSSSFDGATITITQATARIAASSTTTTTAPLPEVKPESTTVSIQTTAVAENKSAVTTAIPTRIPESSARPKTDHEGENTTTSTTEATNIKPVEPTSSTRPDVNAHHDPTERPRKTLFGFVTVEILIALLAGALFSILLVAFLVYRLKKRNEGSYELSETIALRPKELDEMGTKKEVFV